MARRRRKKGGGKGKAVIGLILIGAVGYGAWHFLGGSGDVTAKVADPQIETVETPVVPVDVVTPEAINEPAAPADKTDSPVTEAPVVLVSTQSDDEALKMVERGRQLVTNNQWVEGRELLNKSLVPSGRLSLVDAQAVRDELARLNEEMIFSHRIVPGDPYVDVYTVQEGDTLGKVAPQFATPWQLLERINRVKASRIRTGNRLKVLKGPFHAVVHKKDFRLDLYLGDLYVRSYRVGLGEFGSTPVGKYKVNSKLENPEWVNPRTGKKYWPDDPENPIGEHWIGLVGDEEGQATLTGYGIHGTTDKDSIGKEKSMGCVRLGDEDVHWLYDMLELKKSKIVILAQ